MKLVVLLGLATLITLSNGAALDDYEDGINYKIVLKFFKVKFLFLLLRTQRRGSQLPEGT